MIVGVLFLYLATAAAARSMIWTSIAPRFVILFLFLGLASTVAIERWATATARWRYTPAMPSIGGVGIAPLLQWTIIPLVIAAIARRIGRSRRKVAAALR